MDEDLGQPLHPWQSATQGHSPTRFLNFEMLSKSCNQEWSVSFFDTIKLQHFSQEETMTTELILIRHGYTVRVHGDYVHAPLTPLGQEQAAQTGQYLSASQQLIHGFYTSPLRRARRQPT